MPTPTFPGAEYRPGKPPATPETLYRLASRLWGACFVLWAGGMLSFPPLLYLLVRGHLTLVTQCLTFDVLLAFLSLGCLFGALLAEHMGGSREMAVAR